MLHIFCAAAQISQAEAKFSHENMQRISTYVKMVEVVGLRIDPEIAVVPVVSIGDCDLLRLLR